MSLLWMYVWMYGKHNDCMDGCMAGMAGTVDAKMEGSSLEAPDYAH